MNRAEALKNLAALRGRARVQAHLFSMDARERWSSIEEELTAIENNLQHSAEGVVAALAEKTTILVERAEAFLERHAVGSLTLHSPAERAMSAAPATCSPSDSLNAAAQIMWEEDCGVVPVVDSAGTLVGIITDRDICMACYTQGKPPAEITVASAMSQAAYGVRLEATLAQVIDVMKTRRVRRVPILSPDGHLLGIVSLADLFRHLPEQSVLPEFEGAITETLIAISAKDRPLRSIRAIAAE